MRLPWDVRLGNVAFKPICGRTLLILSFSQHSQLFVNSLILFYGISPRSGALRPVSRGKTGHFRRRLCRTQCHDSRQSLDPLKIQRLVSQRDSSRHQLVLGSPGEVVRKLTTGEQKGIEELAEKYVAVAKHYCRLE